MRFSPEEIKIKVSWSSQKPLQRPTRSKSNLVELGGSRWGKIKMKEMRLFSLLRMYSSLCMYMYVCIHVCMHENMCICICAHVCVCVHVHMCIWIYACIHDIFGCSMRFELRISHVLSEYSTTELHPGSLIGILKVYSLRNSYMHMM